MALVAHDRPAGAELGDRFGDVRLLSAGSRCTVYLGREKDTGRQVAIKVPDGRAEPWLHEVLDREADILARVGAHPNIVTHYQRYTLDDGRPALVMEYCPGSLDDALHGDGRLPLQSVVSTGIKLAGALETTHRAGVLHCDVRPRNVLLTEFDEPVLTGFDEAVDADAGAAHPPMHVTTAHTAPELLEGQPVTAATDVYGLASTMYELITGRAAFRAYVGESPAKVIVRVLSGTVAPIVDAGVPIEVSDLITWAMQPDPTTRPPSAAWFAEELGRIERREGWPRTRLIAG